MPLASEFASQGDICSSDHQAAHQLLVEFVVDTVLSTSTFKESAATQCATILSLIYTGDPFGGSGNEVNALGIVHQVQRPSLLAADPSQSLTKASCVKHLHDRCSNFHVSGVYSLRGTQQRDAGLRLRRQSVDNRRIVRVFVWYKRLTPGPHDCSIGSVTVAELVRIKVRQIWLLAMHGHEDSRMAVNVLVVVTREPAV